MKTVAILTDFTSHDPAYSLCGVVANQVKMLVSAGYTPKLLVRKGFRVDDAYPGAEIIKLDPGQIGNNVVEVTSESNAEIQVLRGQMIAALEGVDVVLTHDMIYQANMWKYHVAARRVTRDKQDLKWLHWVHSSTDLGVAAQTGEFSQELTGEFPRANLVVMHMEEFDRKGDMYRYPPDKIVEIPNPLDLIEDYHPAAQEIIKSGELHQADVIAVYPARLDRGKQVEIIIDIFRELNRQKWDARLVVVDFHSTAGDKSVYREELKQRAWDGNPPTPIYFTSSETSHLDKDFAYHLPHKAVMDLFEYSDVFIHPSRSESDPLTVPEAAWKRCGLILNYDLPVFRLWQGGSLQYKFSSNIDTATGMPGETETSYVDRGGYMSDVAANIAYLMDTNPVLANHAKVRKERSLEAVWHKNLWPAIA